MEQTPVIIHGCPAENTLKIISGKWKSMILRLAVEGPLRFNTLLKQLPGSNKEPVSHALKNMEEADVLKKNIIPALKTMENLSGQFSSGTNRKTE